jgi:uncharacterized protein
MSQAQPRARIITALSISIVGVILAYVFDHLGGGWVERYRSTMVSAVWLYLPLPFVLRRDKNISDYGISLGTGFRGLLETLGASIAVLIPFYAVFFMIYPMKWGLMGVFSRNLIGVALAQFLVVAIPEEFFFRGFLQTELDSASARKVRILGADVGFGWPAVAIIFAVAHIITMPIPFRFMVFFPALLFGWVRARTGSLLYAAIMHAIFNITFLIAQRMATM